MNQPELVFQTGMVGYPESITDPSYYGQIMVFTYPLVGNYGFPKKEINQFGIDNSVESDTTFLKGIVVREYVDKYNHHAANKSLNNWMIEHKLIGISGIDTRKLTKYITKLGFCQAWIIPEPYHKILHQNIDNHLYISTLFEKELAYKAYDKPLISYNCIDNSICNNLNQTQSNGHKILFIDCGAKNSQLTYFLQQGYQVDRINSKLQFNNQQSNNQDQQFNIYSKLSEYSGIFISNGPGNPEKSVTLIEFIRNILYKNIPIFGICYGHQILGLASGFKVIKMKYGNRGHNIPAKLMIPEVDRCLITSQNHGYCLQDDQRPNNWEILFANKNDNSNEGIYNTKYPLFSVQFHPEARGGTNDAQFLFDIFDKVIKHKQQPISVIKKYFLNQTNCALIDNINTGNLQDQKKDNQQKKILVLGSGGLSIGQAGEFDYSGSQAIKAYREEGYQVVLINPNIATNQTSKDLADRIYYLPINVQYVSQVIEKEKPNYITVSFGGQTSLNCGMLLQDKGILEKYNVEILGTNLESVKISESRELFNLRLQRLGIDIIPSKSIQSLQYAPQVGEDIGYPVLVRAGYCLGGQGSGFANNNSELMNIADKAFQISTDVIIDKSLYGWKELEYEIVRDKFGNTIAVCNMENLDPLGIHTGESIVIAPSQTLNDHEYQTLRDTCIKIVSSLNIVGECNVQFAVNPHKFEFYVIEMNARLSRSSALASKATGYPLAYIAAKLSLGYSLTNIQNKVTGKTIACFEPSLDYVVLKIPRWDLSKFPLVSRKLGSYMKSIGEVMSIGCNFKEALQKAIRMIGDLDSGLNTCDLKKKYQNDESFNNNKNNFLEYIDSLISIPTSRRIYNIFNILYANILNINEIHDKSRIDKWFLYQISDIVRQYKIIESFRHTKNLYLENPFLIKISKQSGFCDKQISIALETTEAEIRDKRHSFNILPIVKQIDTVAGEFPAQTNYLYLTYNATHHDNLITNKYEYNENQDKNQETNQEDVKTLTSCENNNIIVLGSGVYRIGSSVEFDWCSVSCINELRAQGFKSIIVNNNPETVSTDYDVSDKLYFEEITVETVNDIYKLENPKGIILSMGGQIPNNIAVELSRQKLNIIGTPADMIDSAENRYKFSRMLDKINVDQPKWKELTTLEDAKDFCNTVGYPCLVRPSYVLSGAAMNVAHQESDLMDYLSSAKSVSPDHPVVISKFIMESKEIEVDAVANHGHVVILAISEHIENAGVHSGDASLVLPAQDLTKETIKRIKEITYKIGKSLHVHGPFNLQLIAKNDELKVIECNCRVSRSFPFASKTIDINFIKIATQIMIDRYNESEVPNKLKFDRIGVKVPQFSFHRLDGADSILGVDMVSTGEVAAFGCNRNIAYMKALASTGFKIPNINQSNILLLIDSYHHREEFINSIQYMNSIKWNIYSDYENCNYYQSKGISELKMIKNAEIRNMIKDKKFNLVINITDPKKLNATKDIISEDLGYQIRRQCIDYGISLMTDIKCSKLLIESIYYFYHNGQTLDLSFDCRGKNIDKVGTESSLSGNKIFNNLLDFGSSFNSQNTKMLPNILQKSLDCISVHGDSIDENLYLNHDNTKIVFTDLHILSEKQFSRNLLRKIFLRAQEFMSQEEIYYNQILKGKTFGLLFSTPSTRTRCSFESAIKKLGGNTILVNQQYSSSQKGETLLDTIITMNNYTDGLIIRSPNDVNLANEINNNNFIDSSIINAGDSLEHPTQALLDLFTIREERGTITGIKIALVGDLLHSRTIHSLVLMLTNYDVEFYFVAPEEFQIPDSIIQELENRSMQLKTKLDKNFKFNYQKNCNLSEVLGSVDVVYMTRLQKERFINQENADLLQIDNYYQDIQLTPPLLTKAKKNLVIMHPLPRGPELHTGIDNDVRAAYFRQMKYGLYIRMVLLEMMFSNH